MAEQSVVLYEERNTLGIITLNRPEKLNTLNEAVIAGIAMAVLTNKPVRFSQAIVDGLGLHSHFRRVYGGNSFEYKKPHPVGIETLMSEYGAAHEKTVMVGDSAVDVQTARNANVKACGVTWGFQPETFAADPPDVLINRPDELAEMVMGGG